MRNEEKNQNILCLTNIFLEIGFCLDSFPDPKQKLIEQD
jgi:hypothetical protein